LSERRKPSISVIGAGRLGQALALALHQSDYSVVALVARHGRKAEKAAKLLATSRPVPMALAADELGKLPASDLILISTPDDSIAGIARELAATQSDGKTTVLHTSGALSSDVLKPMAAKGFQTGSLHPLVSVSEPVSGAAAFHNSFFCVEGSRQAQAQARKIVRDLGGKSFTIKAEKKVLYHAAAVMTSPHLTALFDVAVELLSACGLSRREAQKVFLPLLESTVNNLKTSTPAEALTGTFARGDIETVKRHLTALPEPAREIYKLLGRHSLQLAKQNGLDPKQVARIEKLLKRN
jgi:predicted short-subunit dehydrogenase-like oxidoreductase (DUF2520 family)